MFGTELSNEKVSFRKVKENNKRCEKMLQSVESRFTREIY